MPQPADFDLDLPGAPMAFLRILPGSREVGRGVRRDRLWDYPAHTVQIEEAYYFGRSSVTQGQWEALRRAAPDARLLTNPSGNQSDPNLPVENVSWVEALRFANTLSRWDRRTPAYQITAEEVQFTGSDGFRLPMEAEWEYAVCICATVELWRLGPASVWEWCLDPWDPGAYVSRAAGLWVRPTEAALRLGQDAVPLPGAGASAAARVVRGGGKDIDPARVDLHTRSFGDPKKVNPARGFRLMAPERIGG